MLALLCWATGAAAAESRASLALQGATIYPSPDEPPLRDGVVLIDGARIVGVGARGAVRVPSGVRTIDCSGLTVVAGFYNSHVHFTERKWHDAATLPSADLNGALRAMLTRWGFTSVFDTGSEWRNTKALRERIESGELAGPRIRSTGEIVFPKAGAPKRLLLEVLGAHWFPVPEVSDPAEAAAAAVRLLDAGVDGIKLYAATWAPPIVSLSTPTISAAAKEAHRRGRLVFAHPSNREGLTAAIAGGADVIVHTAANSGVWDAPLLKSMKERGVALVPTLMLWRWETRHDAPSRVADFVQAPVEQLRAYAGVGGVVLFGTDVGYVDDHDPTEEYALMAQAGLSARQILASLTTAPATRFGDAGRLGRVASGQIADLVVLGKDPNDSVKAFADVRYTLKAGAVIYDASAEARESQTASVVKRR